MKRALTCLALLLALSACGADSEESGEGPKPTPTRGTIAATVISSNTLGVVEMTMDGVVSTSCDEMPAAYAELRTGAEARLFDGENQVVSTATLTRNTNGSSAGLSTTCAWNFTFEDVPTAQGPYHFEVGSWVSDPSAGSGIPEDTPLVLLAD